MKRVVALSLFLLVFVCSLFSEDISVTECYTIGNGLRYLYNIELTDYGYLENSVYAFSLQGDAGLWNLPQIKSEESCTLYVASSPDSDSIELKVNDTGKATAYGYLSNGKDFISFFKTLLKDSFIVFDVYRDGLPYRFYWYIPRNNDEARLDALEQLLIYETYLYDL